MWQQVKHTPWSQSLQRSTCSSNRCTWWGLPAGFWEPPLNQWVRCRDAWSYTGSQTLCRWFHSGKKITRQNIRIKVSILSIWFQNKMLKKNTVLKKYPIKGPAFCFCLFCCCFFFFQRNAYAYHVRDLDKDKGIGFKLFWSNFARSCEIY